MGAAFVDESIALLERTPRILLELLRDLPDGWLHEPDIAGGWTPRDVVGHLISAELNNWISRVEMVVQHGATRPFEAFDRFAHLERDAGLPLTALLERFAELRAQNLRRLQELVKDEGDLDRPGLHPELGRVTLRQLLATWTVHDLDHLAQIHAALAASREASVGPWQALLGILVRREAATQQG